MKYTLEIDDRTALVIRQGLGKLPHDDVRPIIEDLAAQIQAQDRHAALPPLTQPEQALLCAGN